MVRSPAQQSQIRANKSQHGEHTSEDLAVRIFPERDDIRARRLRERRRGNSGGLGGRFTLWLRAIDQDAQPNARWLDGCRWPCIGSIGTEQFT